MSSLTVDINSNFIDVTFSLIDEKIQKYFLQVENKLVKNISTKKGLYNINKEEIINKVIKNKDFCSLINSISEALNIEFQEFNGYPFTPSINNEKIIICNFNSTLINQYKLSHLITEKGEEYFGYIVEKSILGWFNNQLLEIIYKQMDFTDIMMDALDINFQSSRIFSKHQKDVENRIKGILLNIKYRLLRSIKEQICEYLDTFYNLRKNA
ncbi:hypothetical protein [Alkaliphilus serpentinus]|uniref:Uncharacterized protein n=1 Tax=Alkaliphilus serpentinus TaxID=1482731 RepID=A0A833M5X0_9FIRM|nr:hypothetical protein [Alkaliphilus serpentinus]KAB3525581.1 hypothetical protein F8153_14910 [Alkaliphilus serpentinus]